MWSETRKEAMEKLNERVDVLVKEHELNEEKVFVNRGAERTCIFRQAIGFLYNGSLHQEQTLSVMEVPHCSSVADTKHITTTEVEGDTAEVDDDFKNIIGGCPVLD